MKRLALFAILFATVALSQQTTRVVHEGQLVTAGSVGATANLTVKKDTSNPTRYMNTALGDCGDGVAQTTAATGATFYMFNKPGAEYTMIADGTITAGRLVTTGASTAGRVSDTGATAITSVPNTVCIIGVAQTSATVGNPVTVRYAGAGTYGEQLIRGFGATFDGGGSALTGSGSVIEYVTVPYPCTVVSYDILITGGGNVGFILLKVGSGSALPAAPTNQWSVSGWTSSSPAAHSTNVSDLNNGTTGLTTAVAANDIVGINLSASATATKARLQVQCQ